MTLLQKYEQFLAIKSSGLKARARGVASEIIESYRGSPDLGFVYEICDRCEHRIDHFIWKEIVFPELSSRIDDDPDAVRALIKVSQSMYQAKDDWERIGFITEDQLTIRYLEMRPGDAWAISKRIEQLRRWLAYTVHEWPWALLCGPDAATRDECGEILDAIRELRGLDVQGKYATLCDDVLGKAKLFLAWHDSDPSLRLSWDKFYQQMAPD